MATFVDATDTGNSVFTTSRSVAVPTGVSVDTVVVCSLSRWDSGGVHNAVTPPAGFTHIGQFFSGDGNSAIDLWWKRLTGVDSGTYDFSWSGSNWTELEAIAFDGVVTTGDPVAATDSWSGTAGTFGDTTVTADEGAALIWRAYWDTPDGLVAPTGYTLVVSVDVAGKAYRIAPSTGSHTASGGSVTTTSAAAAILVALAPGASGQTVTIGQPAETDTAHPLTPSKTAHLGRSVEADIARPLTLAKTAHVGRSGETDTARPVTAAKTAHLGQAAAVEVARPMTVTKTARIGRAAETDVARTVTVAGAIEIGQARSTETARPMAVTKTARIGTAAEVDAARPMFSGRVVIIGQARETSTARLLSPAKTAHLGQAHETDLAHALRPSRLLHIGQAAETDTAATLAAAKTVRIGRVVERDLARSMAVTGGFQLVPGTLTTDDELAASLVAVHSSHLTAKDTPEATPTGAHRSHLAAAHAAASILEGEAT